MRLIRVITTAALVSTMLMGVGWILRGSRAEIDVFSGRTRTVTTIGTCSIRATVHETAVSRILTDSGRILPPPDWRTTSSFINGTRATYRTGGITLELLRLPDLFDYMALFGSPMPTTEKIRFLDSGLDCLQRDVYFRVDLTESPPSLRLIEESGRLLTSFPTDRDQNE